MEKQYLPAEEQEAERNSQFQTKSALSNSNSAPFEPSKLEGKFTFSKSERLTSEVVIDKLFKEGKAVNMGSFALLYLPHTLPGPFPAQITFAVSKRNFRHAHERNRVKRLMRECWRQHKLDLYKILYQQQLQLAVCVMYRGKLLPGYEDVQTAVAKLVEKLMAKVSQTAI